MQASDVQVWIETRRDGAQLVVVPCARSAMEAEVGFRVNATCRSANSRSSVSQQGQMSMDAGHRVELGHISLGASEQMACEMEVVLSIEGRELGVFRFDLADQ